MEKSNLIVNYLASSIDDAQLTAMFAPFGTIQSVKIVRDKSTGASMGFGFVNFDNNDSAAMAIKSLNGKEVADKQIKISLARPAWKANIHSNLFMCNLPADKINLIGVKEVFADFAGNIENVRQLRDNIHGKGSAVVRFDSEDSAHRAMRKYNGVQLDDATCEGPVMVKPWRPEFRQDRSKFDNESATDDMFNQSQMSNDPNNPGRSPDGQSASINGSGHRRPRNRSHPRNPHPMGATGGYMDMYDPMAFDPSYYPYDNTQNGFYDPTGMYPYTTGDVSVMNEMNHRQPSGHTEESIRSMFEEFGVVESVTVLQDQSFGFVNYYEKEHALSAVRALNGRKVGNQYLKVEEQDID